MDKSYHFIGIGGIGMSALALILAQKGAKVSGSDLNASYTVENLQKAGVKIFIGHRPENIPPRSTVIYSTDIPIGNVELKCAQDLRLPLLHRAELLKEL